ncbi:uncharacterized protein N7482_003769 [Penicillium canariense]|uniref:Xylanolytic transcriptional activator regulatory domain-containing protein n=1 Tax=Penicillium canariense TaxID=189055 RepID=A0A9W9LPM5_9EURO|nr:uncharacterized protein N7482_003769 [Penicillium canariense]KAJ5168175.1 hypothetical protein N7482_003769 [Penicillium canariense]
MEPGVLLIHAPTFQREYEQCWEQPQTVGSTWLGLLFTIMCLAIHLHHRSEDKPSDSIRHIHQTSDTFRVQAARCLVDAKYTTPSKYTIETLMLYTYAEYFESQDPQHEIWILLGIIMRLAMRMGLHRDPARYPKLSCFQGEMRRRVWTFLAQLDTLFSFQMGLPRMLKNELTDTEFPCNLLDEDFDDGSTTLPPPRPETESTLVSYLVAKSRIVAVFGIITDHVASTQPNSYESVLQLDRQLCDACASIPQHLRFRGISQSIIEMPHIIMRRYQLEIVSQKARCVLHRKYLTEDIAKPLHPNSRAICIDAAVKLLKYQADIDTQTQPGGVLGQNRWFVTSLNSHDFILAAVIVCLELHFCSKNVPEDDSLSGSRQENIYVQELVHALQISHSIWDASKDKSREAMQAFKTITVMLEKANVPRTQYTNYPTNDMVTGSAGMTKTAEGGCGLNGNSNGEEYQATTADIDEEELLPADRSLPGCGPVGNIRSLSSLGLPSEDITMQDIWDFSGSFDWNAWDAAIQTPFTLETHDYTSGFESFHLI